MNKNMLPFRFFIYYYIICLVLFIPAEIIQGIIYKIYNSNIVIATLLLIVTILYCTWSTKYSLNKSLLSEDKKFYIITDIKQISWQMSFCFFSISIFVKFLINMIIKFIITNTNSLIVFAICDISDYFIFNIFFMNKIKAKKKDIDPIHSDVF